MNQYQQGTGCKRRTLHRRLRTRQCSLYRKDRITIPHRCRTRLISNLGTTSPIATFMDDRLSSKALTLGATQRCLRMPSHVRFRVSILEVLLDIQGLEVSLHLLLMYLFGVTGIGRLCFEFDALRWFGWDARDWTCCMGQRRRLHRWHVGLSKWGALEDRLTGVEKSSASIL